MVMINDDVDDDDDDSDDRARKPQDYYNIVCFFIIQLSAVLNVSNALVDLIDIQGSSVMVCFEDGWDVTSQVQRNIEIIN